MRRSLAAALVVLAITPAAVAAGQPAKAGGAVVKIDFRALTEEGQQVTDLKPDEITLKVNGKPRQIQSLSVFHGATAGPATGGSSLPAPYATNAVGHEGRVIHMLIDDDSIGAGRESGLREAVRLLVAELAPGDRLGVLTTQGQVNLRPMDDPAQIKAAVDKIAGRGPTNETESDAQCRTTRVLAALGSMLALTGGTPTTIIVFAGGLSPPTVKQVTVGSRGSTGTNEVCPVTPEAFQNMGSVAATAHADLYLFHLTEAMTNRSSAQDAGIESLAGVTAAEFVRISASPQAAVARLLRETAAYYVATFQPEPSERNGQAYRVEMRAARDKVRLRARPAVTIAKDIVKAAASPKEMLRTQAAFTDLSLRAAAHTSRTPGSDEVKVLALFETIDPSVSLKDASVGLFDEKNTLKKQWSAQPADLQKRPVVAALVAPPGIYRVRVAAIDAAGRAGATDYELKVEVPRADPLKMSTLVLGTQQQGGFAARLDFSTEPIAIGLLEIYGVPRGGTVTVDLDLVSTPEGTALATAPTTVGQGNTEDMRSAFGGFSIAGLPAGDYLMRAVVSLDGKPVGKVVRTLRKS